MVRKTSSILLLFVFIAFLNIPAYSICSIENQKKIESKISQITDIHREKLQNEDNAIRTSRLIKDYYKNLRQLLCLEETLHFSGKVWSVDFMNDGSGYILRVGSFNPAVSLPFFYNYRFSQDDKLINKLETLSKGDRIRFDFSFIDTLSPSSDNFRGKPFPVESNPDTGNLVYFLFVNMKSIEVVK